MRNFPPKERDLVSSCARAIVTFHIGLHEMCVRTGVRYVMTKFSGEDSLPNFLTHGAPLRMREELRYNRMKTNLGRRFLNIVDRCFPKNHPLHKIFNRHTLKLSYSCRPNMKTITLSHNK